MGRSFRAPPMGILLAMLLAGALRLAWLGDAPVSLYCDEAFSGYEAYCLLQTGRDSRGVLLPLFFDIFGKGWGEPLYIYLTVPAVALFGLTPLAARFTAAMGGTLAVGATGLLCASLLRPAAGARPAARAGTAAAFLMAVSPWPFHLSRVAFQASLLPAMLAGGFWLATRAVAEDPSRQRQARPAMLMAGAALLGLSLYTYTVARLAMPLLLAGFVWLHRRSLTGRAWRPAAAAGLLLAALAAPVAMFSLTGQGQQRFSDVSVFTNSRVATGGMPAAAAVAAANYLSYHSPAFLLTRGDDNLRHSIRGHGMLHPHDVALLVFGIAACLLLRTPGALFALWWLLAYPAAAALTADPRHAVRAICGQPALFALEGIGAALIWGAAFGAGRPIARRAVTLALTAAFALACLAPVLGYFRDYFIDYPVYSGPAWQYGLKEAFDVVESESAGHDSVYVTRYEEFPDIHLLFHRAFPPREYQQHRLTRTKYLFGRDRWVRGEGRLNPIFIWKPKEVPESGAPTRRVIKYPDGQDAFVIAW